MNRVEMVAMLISHARARRRGVELFDALKNLLEDTQHSGHHCGDADCPVLVARQLVREIEGQR